MTAEAIIQSIDIEDIAFSSDVRGMDAYEPSNLRELMASIRSRGILSPIIVRAMTDDERTDNGPRFAIVAGRRRMHAASLVGMGTVPAIVRDLDVKSAQEIELIENIQREQLSLTNTANGVRLLLATHGKPATVAKVLGKSPGWVSKHLTLSSASFPGELTALLHEGIVTDLETLMTMRQAWKTKGEAATTLRTKWLKAIRNARGITRELAKQMLEQVRASETAATKAEDATATNDEDDGAPDEQNDTPDDTPRQDQGAEETFTVRLPVALLDRFNEIGGVDWLTHYLSTGQLTL